MAATATIADDIRAIEALIDRQFRSLDWSEGREADWMRFASDFHPQASLFPSARPAKRQTVDAFVRRMQAASRSSLRTFKERMLGAEVRVFGNVAVAVAACENTENAETITRNVEALLLIKEEGAWKIVSQAWDVEREGNPVPANLLL